MKNPQILRYLAVSVQFKSHNYLIGLKKKERMKWTFCMSHPLGMGRDGFLNYLLGTIRGPSTRRALCRVAMISGCLTQCFPLCARLNPDSGGQSRSGRGVSQPGIWAWRRHNTHVCGSTHPRCARRSSRVLLLRFSISVISGQEKSLF